jgi:hypothetical protein
VNGPPGSQSRTSEIERAVAFGIDVSLLHANLALRPSQRLSELVEMNRLHDAIQARTMSSAQRDQLAAERTAEKLRMYGPERSDA